MSRITPRRREDLPEFDDLWKRFEENTGYVPNSLLTLAHRPDILRAMSEFSKAVNAPGEVAPELKRLMAHVLSRTAGCQYCAAHTAHAAREWGMADAKIEAAFEYETNPLFSEAERALLRFAQGAASVPNAVTDADFESLREHFSEVAIVEIVAMIAWFGFWNRWNDTMATELEPDPRAFADTHLAPSGWTVGKHA
ncbi:MAG: peroxidase-related enzyme [Rhodospirillales bacterium]|jgi:uncharacterized peroxidase-related enzyme|nr:peroxidase-related enzyme [Rhodospirillales bacterium]